MAMDALKRRAQPFLGAFASSFRRFTYAYVFARCSETHD
jgi:hypothetical protein